jgi:atypical dual specificity phosphatase
MTKIGDAYRWIHSHVLERPTNFGWVIDGKLAGSGLPLTYDQFEWAVAEGIRSIVSVREVPLPSEWLAMDNGKDGRPAIDYLFLKVADYDAPAAEEMDGAVDHIQRQIAADRPVMVHCAAGKGRTGTVLAAYFMKTKGLSADEAIEWIRSMRPGSVQSTEQEMRLQEYERYIKKSRAL